VTDTRPSDQAQKIAQEVALLKKADDEREFREHVLVSLERLNGSMLSMAEAFKDHVKQDDSRFGAVTQTVNDNKATINKAVGGVAVLAAIGGAIMWLIDRLSP